jgi:hypothetical protein
MEIGALGPFAPESWRGLTLTFYPERLGARIFGRNRQGLRAHAQAACRIRDPA